MYKSFREKLPKAQGRSEFVIAVIVDIRGFSTFSTVNESPNIAMYIKRFYLQMINHYFPGANFVKPTGDGLLMTFPYDEDNLLNISETIFTSCFKCLEEFPTFCRDDPMINFTVPDRIGFGIARGTACCLYAGNEILDYSGHLLNLSSRLMELARPSGIVVDGGYKKSVIPEALRDLFEEQNVYLRSIAEDTAVTVLYLKDYVDIPDFYLSPMVIDKWISQGQELTIRELLKIPNPRCVFLISKRPKSTEKIRVTLVFPKKSTKGHSEYDLPFEYPENPPTPRVTVETKHILELISRRKLNPNSKIKFRIDYVPS